MKKPTVAPRPVKFLTQGQIQVMFQITRPTVSAWVRDGLLPQPSVFGRLFRWKETEVLEAAERLKPKG